MCTKFGWNRSRRFRVMPEHTHTHTHTHIHLYIHIYIYIITRAGNVVYAWKETISKVMVAIRPKVSLWTDGGTGPRNYRWPFEHPWIPGLVPWLWMLSVLLSVYGAACSGRSALAFLMYLQGRRIKPYCGLVASVGKAGNGAAGLCWFPRNQYMRLL
jgi:hypothetical protein